MIDGLKDHQKENVEWIQRVRKGLLADQPGLGKSRSALTAVSGMDSTLIIAPKMIINTRVWQEEIEKWGLNPERFTIAPYSMLNDLVDQRSAAEVAAGKPKRLKPTHRIREEYRGHYDAVIIDEAHNIKGRGNYWTEAVKKISSTADLIMPMTGTPIPNWAHELFTLLQVIYPHEAKRGQKYGAFWRWAEEWFDTTPDRYSQGKPKIGQMLGCTPRCMQFGPEHPCEHYRAFTDDNLGAHWMRHMRSDCLDLPPLNTVTIDSPMAAKAAALYKDLRSNFAGWYGEHEVLAWSQGALNVKLDKLTTSPWLLTNMLGEPHGGKFDLLESDLIGRQGEPTLVLAHYRDTVEACARVAQRLGLRADVVHGGSTDKQVDTRVEAFKRGKLDVLVGSLETLAEGVTLTVASEAILVERSFKPSRNEQAIYRIHRMGQERACTITRYITPKTVDAKKERLLLEKSDHQMRTMKAAEFSRIL